MHYCHINFPSSKGEGRRGLLIVLTNQDRCHKNQVDNNFIILKQLIEGPILCCLQIFCMHISSFIIDSLWIMTVIKMMNCLGEFLF